MNRTGGARVVGLSLVELGLDIMSGCKRHKVNNHRG